MFIRSAAASSACWWLVTELNVKHAARALKPAEAASGVAVIDAVAVNSAAARQLYKKREPIYPKLVHGPFRTLKWALLVLTLGVYYVLPWIRWPRGPAEPDQAALVDFAGGRFYFFFIEIWPSELYFVTGLLILAALALFLATALFGRVWCGYACPQTVWTDLFIAAERLIEGDRNARIKLAKAPWTIAKVLRKTAKHAVWIAIAAATGGAWILYFHDAPTIAQQFLRGEAPLSAYFFAGLLTFTTYMLAGSMREQVCTYMCPWPRIQAALTDQESLQVTYRVDRGEPRGAHKKGESWSGRGDCVDCKACVAVCPMGIDIRDGAQLECINCALCIDACDEVMTKIGRPKGLIAYDNDTNMARRRLGEKPRFKLVRARTILYAAVLALVGAIMIAGFSARETTSLNVLKDRTPPFVRLSDGSIRNAYTLKIVNKESEAREFVVRLDSAAPLALTAVGTETVDGALRLTIAGDDVRAVRVFVTAAPGAVTAPATALTFAIEDPAGDTISALATFMTERKR
ncbi:MAG: cytochrome c oxidase accessory protein CcoG [Parvularculaceae bacterium]|nr:cytochrome c oxidase accessory protein CcoG [Parvularculaceae bacterium]